MRSRSSTRPRRSAPSSSACRARRSGRVLARNHPERVDGAAFIGRRSRWRRRCPSGRSFRSTSRSTPTKGGRSTTVTTGGGTTADFLEFFMSKCFTEPHSTKQIEDAVGWGLETDPEVLADLTPASTWRPASTAASSASVFAARCSSSTATRTRSTRTRAAWRSPRRRAGRSSRSRAPATSRRRATR